ncbi:microfibrillar-associated protein 2 isoform 1-T1 [Cyanocitta cristata]
MGRMRFLRDEPWWGRGFVPVGLQEAAPEGAGMVLERTRRPEGFWGEIHGIGAGQGPWKTPPAASRPALPLHHSTRMRATGLFVLCLPVLLAQGQYSRFEGITYPEPVQYSQYDQQAEIQDYYDYHDVTPRAPEEQFRYQSQQQSQQETVPAPTPAAVPETEPTEPGPLDCREEQYPCTRLYSVHKPCKQCLNEICFYSLRRVYVINKEICVRTVCAHEELLRADLCRDKFSKCGVMATSGLCQSVGASCARSCGGC